MSKYRIYRKQAFNIFAGTAKDYMSLPEAEKQNIEIINLTSPERIPDEYIDKYPIRMITDCSHKCIFLSMEKSKEALCDNIPKTEVTSVNDFVDEIIETAGDR